MDACDLAQIEIERQEDRARDQREAMREIRDSADECVECSALIPSARQLAAPGCQMCIDCAELAEQM